MQFVLESLLDAAQVGALRQALLAADAPWRDGAATAGWHARSVKNNRQLARDSPLHQMLRDRLEQQLLDDPLLQAAALPKHLHGLLFSRMGPGEGYGCHIDNAFMAGGRSDLSFTLFLSDPTAYEGGALVLERPHGEESLRLPAGQAFVYPSTLLHRVEPVQRGERLVAVGWIESRVRSAEQRELLFELDTARRSLFAREGKSEEFDLLCRCHANLLRLWGG
ncbi:MAG: Fe2+-dependent dioxygenase [Synechococcaceae cyanobacterium]|nr:Fe2+-dependent dioxygenase [Synechococcaceae cyanobacterium]